MTAPGPGWALDSPPLFAALADAERVLIAGAGGGHDVLAGVPLRQALVARGIDVSFANLSFAGPGRLCRFQVADQLFAVRPVPVEAELDLGYLPELHLARWLSDRQADPVVYAFPQTGLVPLTAAYRQLVALTRPDAVVLIDGGVDALLTGSETRLGTPAEDITSLLAVDAVQVDTKLLVCTAFGVDAHDGVAHTQVLEAIANLDLDGAFLGALSLLRTMPEVAALLELIDVMTATDPDHASIVLTSLAAALRGGFGDTHSISRTLGDRLFVSPLMPLYWTFHLPAVAARVSYANLLEATHTLDEVVQAIQSYRGQINPQPFSHWPF
jgi:hypothetical protein